MALARSISAYVTALVEAGLRIERLREARQGAVSDVVANRAERDAGRVPGLLYARATKL